MSSRNVNRKNPSRRSRKARKGEIPSSAISYTGPIIVRSDNNSMDTVTVDLKISSNVTFTSANPGVYAPVHQVDPTGFTDWSTWVSNYAEFRALGMRYEFLPNWSNLNPIGPDMIYGPCLSMIEHTTNVTANTTYDTVLSHSSAQCHSLFYPFAVEWKMSGAEEAQFQTTSSPVSTGSIKLYAATTGTSVGSLSLVAGLAVLTIRIQFRGRH